MADMNEMIMDDENGNKIEITNDNTNKHTNDNKNKIPAEAESEIQVKAKVAAVGKKKAVVPDWRKGKQEEITRRFPVFMGCALLFGILYTFCMYKNPVGITYPFMIVCAYGGLVFMLSSLGMKMKKDSWFLAGAAVLIGISTCRTGDQVLIGLNKTAEFLLVVIFMIHQFYDDREWSIGKYLSAMAVYLCGVIAAIVYPFCQGSYFFKKVNMKKYGSVMRMAAGLAAALPIVMIAGVLLGQADAVFGAIVEKWLDQFFNLKTVMIVLSMTALGTLGIYCLVSGACMDLVSHEEKAVKTHEPVAAIACMSMVALLYLFFCGIQVVYLFMGKGSLPYGMTYSSYARQGFFQLLAVAVINLVMVLCNVKFFRKSRILSSILAVVCGCTYVMIASAAYRMILYVGEYHLTYLRVLVLWFLALLAVMMIGVVAVVFYKRFRLFGWCLTAIIVFYTGFSFMRPDRVIAEYNVKYVDEWSGRDFTYMTQALSADAVPVVLKAIEDDAVLRRFYSGERTKFLADYHRWAVSRNYGGSSGDFRTWNYSFEKAEESFRNGGLKE